MQTSVEKYLLRKDWRTKLSRLIELATPKRFWYEKGQSIPGAAWEKKSIDWHDLALLPDDD